MIQRTSRSAARLTRAFVALLAAGASVLQAATPTPLAKGAEAAGPATTAWLDGDAGRAARELAGRPDRASALNRGVALLYAGDAASAERELAGLRAREPAWTPALRWLARAQAASGSAQLDATLTVLLAAADADSRDFLWTGRLQHDSGRPDAAAASFRAAVTREPDLYLGWLWLGDAEDARGREDRAREAWLRARELHAGGDVLVRLGEISLRAGRKEEGRSWLREALATPEGSVREAQIRALVPDLEAPAAVPRIVPPLRPGEKLSYTARYLIFTFATVEMENRGFTDFRGQRVARIVFVARSRPGFPFLTIDSRFESLVAEDGSVLAHRSSSRDSTQARRAAAYEMDRATGQCVVRQVVEGLYGFDRLPLSPLDQDGISILQLARGMVAAPASLSVLTAVDSTWKGTQLRTVGNERIRWAGREVEAVEVEALGHYKGPAGLSGRVRTWISRDGRAILYKASVQLTLGSVVLDLRPDFEQAAQREPEDSDASL